jgi:tetraprenyl-beta-curcumene synthase
MGGRFGSDVATQSREFARASQRYWLGAFPVVRREASHWRARARSIPSESLRRHAVDTHRVTRNPEGAAAFAVLAPRASRARVTRMLVAFQTMFDYVDTVSEKSEAADPLADALQLHRALEASVSPDPPRNDYYELHPDKDDDGYLSAQVAVSREIVLSLPSYPLVEEAMRRSAVRCGEAESQVNATGSVLAPSPGDGPELGDDRTLRWWEVGAGASSCLCVLALMASAADPALSEDDVRRIESAYHPWIAALSTMLDSLVDLDEDLACGFASQIDRYPSVEEAAQRLSMIASRSFELAADLPQGGLHTAILTGMASYYLAARGVWDARTERISRSVVAALGPLIKPAIAIHRIRQGDPILYPPLPSLGASVGAGSKRAHGAAGD